MADVPSHHLVYGMCQDFVSGEMVADTDDERYRQKLARFLVEAKGYHKNDLESRARIETHFSGQFVVSKIDLVVSLARKKFMIIRYGPGSLVTRERAAIAAARVLDPAFQIPLAVVTNGEDAELLDAYTGKVLGKGFNAIPGKEEAGRLIQKLVFTPLRDERKRERELRILSVFDVEICCAGKPCALPAAKEG